MEMVINGVSTRKVTRITEGLCGTSFSKSTVCRLTKALNEPVSAFLNCRLDASYPFIIVDAMFTKLRTDKRVVSKALLIASGIRADGHREILGLSIGDAESIVAWDEMFRSMKSRGLKDVDFMISDDHAGLRDAIAKSFIGATWQRCQVHVMCNLLAHSPAKECNAVAAAAKLFFAAADRSEAQRRLDEFAVAFAKTAPKAVVCIDPHSRMHLPCSSCPRNTVFACDRQICKSDLTKQLDAENASSESFRTINPRYASLVRYSLKPTTTGKNECTST